MNYETRLALVLSIAKWKRNVVAETPYDVTVGTKTCALCQLFSGDNDCGDCPVKVRAGVGCCRNTPYCTAFTTHHIWSISASNTMLHDAFREAAQREVDFLESLLPAETNQ
jgi:hypothetical protein